MAGEMTPGQVRVGDPVLSNVARGFRQPDLVGSALFPGVPVMTYGGQVLEFDKSDFQLYNTRRAPGGTVLEVSFGHLGKPFALEGHDLTAKVPREWMRDASVMPGIDLARRAINGVMRVLRLGLEDQQASLAVDAANYAAGNKVDLTATPWTADANNPIDHVNDGREAVRSAIGAYPNVAVFSPDAFTAAVDNSNVVDRYKHTTSNVITAEMLAAVLQLDAVFVGKAVKSDSAGTLSDVWGSGNVVLAYANVGTPDAAEPSYGYTYELEGHPMVEEAYWDPGTKSWKYPTAYHRAPVIAGAAGGYLIQGAAG